MIVLLWSSGCGLWNPADSLNYQPSQVPVGPLTIGVWLPAGLDRFRFAPEDQALVAALRINQIEWLQRAGQDSTTAEEIAMDFCNRTGLRMPVYYEPQGFSPYDKLHNWATRTDTGADFAADVRERVLSLRRQWHAEPGLYGYLVGHEDYCRACFPALRQTVEVLRQEDPLLPALTVGRIHDYPAVDTFLDAFFVEGGAPNIFQHEHYALRSDVPLQGRELQRRLGDLVKGYERVARHLQGRYGRWHAIVQVHGETRQGRGFYRQPTGEEIRAQVGLALSQGAAGVVYFLYSSGVEEVRDEEGHLRERREYEGLVDRQGVPTPNYVAVQQVNRLLEQLSPVLAERYFHGGFSGRQPPRNALLRRGGKDLAFGLFGDGVNPTHLLVVNRRTTADRKVGLEIRGEQVADALSGEQLEVRNGEVQVELEAGGLRLLEIQSPAEVGSGG